MASESASTLIRRALRQRCPVCGSGKIFKSHFRMNKTCPVCQVTFWKDPGESLGAMYLDYAVAVGLFLAIWIVLSVATSLSEFWQFVLLATVTSVSIPLFYPLTRSFWTVLVYISGGIDRPPIRVVRGGKKI
jgi:uncharacterized protein (DUF983 family)